MYGCVRRGRGGGVGVRGDGGIGGGEGREAGIMCACESLIFAFLMSLITVRVF